MYIYNSCRNGTAEVILSISKKVSSIQTYHKSGMPNGNDFE